MDENLTQVRVVSLREGEGEGESDMNFEEARPFFERHHWSVVTTHQANGAAHSSIVVCGAHQGHAAFVSVHGKSAKIRKPAPRPALQRLGRLENLA